MMLRIYIDFTISRDDMVLLRDGTTGHELVFPGKPIASVLQKAEWDPQFEMVDVVFGQPDIESIARAKCIKWIQISSSSITRYDNEKFRAQMAGRGIIVTNSASVYSDACADHALSFMLAQSRQLPQGLISRAAGSTDEWRQLRSSSVSLRGQTVLIVGFGEIGKRLTELLHPFDMKVIAYRRKARGDEVVSVVTGDKINDALAQADHVINILPDSGETQHFFSDEQFMKLKAGAVFYNIGRGATVDQDALRTALRSGQVKAAWLDVTDPEPLPDNHPLRSEPNCFITPHVAGGHFNETDTLVRHFLKNYERFIEGKELANRVM